MENIKELAVNEETTGRGKKGKKELSPAAKLWLDKIKLALLFTLVVILWEVAVHLLTFGWLRQESLYMLGFSIPIGCSLALFCSLFPEKVNKILSQIIMVLLAFLYCAQYIYSCIFGSFFSVFQIGMGGEALTSFWKETMSCIGENIPQLILIILPLAIFEVFFFLHQLPMSRINVKAALANLGIILVLHGACLLSLNVDGKNYYSFKDIYFSNNTSTDRSVEILGIITTARLESQHMIFGTANNQLGIVDVEMPSLQSQGGNNDESVGNQDIDSTLIPKKEYNVIEKIDFEYLDTLETQDAIATLNEYFMGQTGTNKNEYTGLFEGYNLITICAESFSPEFITKEMTPTLYRMMNEGIVFNNYYGCYLNNTTNGEYTFCMGIFPDLSRSKSNGSFTNSRNNYLPFCLGNMFDSIGVKAHAYHNYLGSYYNRENTHPNMGYEFQSAQNGMTFTTSWPASDLEMFEQSMDDYLGEEQFHAYYMTFSGHYKYEFDINPMCARNQSRVADLDCSEMVKAYIACNLELEKGLNYLINRLEEEGLAEKTVVVLSNDHYPYGLTDQAYAELAGLEGKPTDFDKCKNAFICWTAGLDEKIEVDEYCCTVDILPTILNLFGFEYDSRLLIGTDVFSDAMQVAILSDQSFITDILKFDSSTGEVTYFVDPADYPSGYLDQYLAAMIKTIKNRLTVSAAILNYDYYNFVFENSGLK